MVSSGNNQVVPPEAEEIEVSIFGPGFGECILLHLTGGQWGVVDSCLDPGSKRPAALHYLESLGVNVAVSVRFIIATHWHDDHVQGMSGVFQQAKAAVFACSEAVREQEFLTVLGAWPGIRSLACGSGVDELRAVLVELKKRQVATRYPAPRLASANKVLWEMASNPSVVVKALSPSDAAVTASIARLREISPSVSKARRRLPNLGSNDTSVVLSVRVGEHHVLLGADLEVRNDRGFGWMAIVDGIAGGRAAHQGFKVAHHGSDNGDHDEIWNRMLVPQPWAVTTPFVSGRVRLPSGNDCRRILNRTRRAYLTAPPDPGRFRDANRVVEKMVSEATISAQFVPSKYGHVRLRKRVDQKVDSEWRVEMFGDAVRLEDYLHRVRENWS